uniref:C-type lectin domain-containing protein n=1 Tax=Stegastes partitus TaxID=144197 RepID=A0A3B5BIP5_9TELE
LCCPGWCHIALPERVLVSVFFSCGTMNWTDAQEYCRTTYTDLTSIRYQADFDIISAKIGDRLIWVGAFADSWKWSEGRDSSFRHWPPSKKFWELNEECGVLTKNNDRWGSLPCSEKRPFLCTCKDPGAALWRNLWYVKEAE